MIHLRYLCHSSCLPSSILRLPGLSSWGLETASLSVGDSGKPELHVRMGLQPPP